MQVGEHSDSFAGLDALLGSRVQDNGLVEGRADAVLDASLGLLHHLDGEQEHARAVIANLSHVYRSV